MNDVTAVLIGPRRDAARALARDAVAGLDRIPSLSHLRASAAAASSSWLWLIDSGAVPAEGALDPLMAADLDLAASLPVDGAGRPIETLVGRFTESDLPAILEAVEMHTVPLRHTHVVSLLARREILLAEGPPDPGRYGRYAGTEWTARMFRGRRAMLVPSSRVLASAPDPGRPVHAIRMARRGPWGRGEGLRELHRSAFGRRG